MENRTRKIKEFIDDIKNNRSHALSYLLSNEVEETLSERGIKIRKLFAPLLRFIYNFQSDYKFVLESREYVPKTDKGKIFIVNHRQGDDMVFSAKAVGESGYFVFGNKILALESLTNGYGLWSYGMILLDRADKKNRASCYDKMKYVIEHGGNIIVFSEGYWNLDDDGEKSKNYPADGHNSENWLIQDINIGAVRLAKETGCLIVPTILHYDECKMKCYGKRGPSFHVGLNDNIFDIKDDILEYMCTEYYLLMEKYSNYSVSELEQNGLSLKEQWEELKKKLVAFCDIDAVSYKLDLSDEKDIGKSPVKNGVTTNNEVFGHLDNIEYNHNNAFLLSKRLTGKNNK